MKRSSLSPHRLARLTRWAEYALLRLARFLIAAAGITAPLERALAQAAAPHLDKIAKLLHALILIKAAALMGPAQPKPRYGRVKSRAALHRILVGSALRRAARGSSGDPRARISALLRLACRLNDHAARLAKRLAGGLTRRRGGFSPESGDACVIGSFLLGGAAHADTS